MKVLAIDIGSYSVKFYEAKIDGKKISFFSKYEVVLDLIKQTIGPNDNLPNEIIAQFLQGKPYNGKIIFQIPNDLLSNRIISIPVASRKKAETMIPFQLEENIPYPLSKTHYTKSLYNLNKSTIATVYITNKENFEKYFEQLKNKNIVPWTLTCEMAVIESLVQKQKPTGSSCILDLGHESTKGYFFEDDRLVSNHFYNIAGKIIDEAIAKTYQIALSDAVIYKHENCFFLIEEQYDKVDKDQKDFALLMKQTFWPLCSKIKQWMIGYKAQTGKTIDKILLLGGSSKIKNIDNFLMEILGVPVQRLNPFVKIFPEKSGLSNKETATFSLALHMAQSLSEKPPLPNFLSADYSIAPKNRISIYNLAFLATRSLILLAILSIGLIFENFILKREEKELEKKLVNIFKYPALNISEMERRNLKKSPELVMKSMDKKSKEIDKEIKNLQMMIKIYPIGPLKSLSSGLSNLTNAFLDSIKFDDWGTTAIFKSESLEGIKGVKEKLRSLGIQEDMLNLKESTRELIFKYPRQD